MQRWMRNSQKSGKKSLYRADGTHAEVVTLVVASIDAGGEVEIPRHGGAVFCAGPIAPSRITIAAEGFDDGTYGFVKHVEGQLKERNNEFLNIKT